jgi:hypothetical protein
LKETAGALKLQNRHFDETAGARNSQTWPFRQRQALGKFSFSQEDKASCTEKAGEFEFGHAQPAISPDRLRPAGEFIVGLKLLVSRNKMSKAKIMRRSEIAK